MPNLVEKFRVKVGFLWGGGGGGGNACVTSDSQIKCNVD